MSFVADMLGVGVQHKASQMQAKAALEQGVSALTAANAGAAQLETRAGQTVATGTYNQNIIAKRAKEIMATQRARAAAGGGDTTDATVMAITDETIKQASMAQLLMGAEAEDKARQDRFGAKVTRYAGGEAYKQGKLGSSAIKTAGWANTIVGTSQAVKNASDIGWAKAFGMDG